MVSTEPFLILAHEKGARKELAESRFASIVLEASHEGGHVVPNGNAALASALGAQETRARA